MKRLQGKIALTGEIAYSMAYPAQHQLTVHHLDGRTALLPSITPSQGDAPCAP